MPSAYITTKKPLIQLERIIFINDHISDHILKGYDLKYQ